MPVIESSRVRDAKPLHRLGQIGVPGLKQKVIMVGHEHKSIYLNAKPLASLSQRLKKYLPVLIVIEDTPSFVSSRKDMVICTTILDSPGSRHLSRCFRAVM